MRKLLKKKVNIFGKTVPVFVLVLLGVGLVSAALVSYLATPIFGTATVASPTTLNLYDEANANLPNQWIRTVSGGEEMMFSKIIHSEVTQDVLFGVALVFKNTDGEGITVTSAGPCGTYDSGQAGKCVDASGNPAPINSDCWCQDLTSEPGYLHGQCSGHATAPFDDAVKVTIGTTDYYVVLFGATTEVLSPVGNALPGTTIRKLGWGNLLTDPIPCHSMVGEGTNLPAGAYDTGTIRVDYAVNLLPQDYLSAIEVVQPGQTLQQVIDELEARSQADGGFA